MNLNTTGAERVSIAAVIAPGSQTAGAKNSGWVNAAIFTKLMAIISTGTMGTGGTIDAKWQQASDSSGTGAADVAQGQLAQVVKASGDNKQATMDLDVNRLTDRTKAYVRLVMTVGIASSDASAIVLGLDARYGLGTDNDLATVTQNARN